MIDRILLLKTTRAFYLYIFLDVVCVGMGMGVPFFCILFGFPVGWYIAQRMLKSDMIIYTAMKKALLYAVITSGVTFIIMAGIWGWCIKMLFDPEANLANFGLPMILYEPTASFIGWLVLMIFISPCLQLLTTVFGAYLTIINKKSEEQRKVNSPKSL